MRHPSKAIEHFFKSLEDQTAMGNIPAVAEHFSETFLAVGPSGAKVARRSAFAQGLPERKQMFDKLGARAPRLVSLEITALDARYTFARSRWLLIFARDGQEPQEVFADSTYIVDTGAEPFKIILYLTSQDLPPVLKERGILTA